ncbi:hypothetical protein AB0395_45530 [Streptosporangium sp. NPDC051023]|uniref:hypothetical protein n=1 Tax=Streptosporangium sp. NPDC051023 TaxID=3155410 RepID=UPI00344B06DB
MWWSAGSVVSAAGAGERAEPGMPPGHLCDRVHVVIYAYENGLVARHEFHPDGRYRVHPFG